MSGQAINYKIGICYFSAKHAVCGVRGNTGWLGIRIMYPSGVTCPSIDYCLSELAL